MISFIGAYLNDCLRVNNVTCSRSNLHVHDVVATAQLFWTGCIIQIARRKSREQEDTLNASTSQLSGPFKTSSGTHSSDRPETSSSDSYGSSPSRFQRISPSVASPPSRSTKRGLYVDNNNTSVLLLFSRFTPPPPPSPVQLFTGYVTSSTTRSKDEHFLKTIKIEQNELRTHEINTWVLKWQETKLLYVKFAVFDNL